MLILLSKNKEIIKSYLKPNANIGFIATASELEENRDYMYKDREDLAQMNYRVIDINISKERKQNILKKFKVVDSIFVAGGNSFYLLQQLIIKDVLQELKEFANNKIYIGSSAGACITCPSIDYAQKLDDKAKAPLLNNYKALNLVDFYILPHYNSKEKYTKLADEIEKEYMNYKFIKLSDNQAIVVDKVNTYIFITKEEAKI